MEPNPFADEPDDLHSEVESLTEDDDLPELPGSPPDSDSDWSTDSDDDPDPSPNPSQTITITSAKGATTTTADATVNSNGHTTVTLVMKKTRTCHSFEFKLRVARKFIALQKSQSFVKLRKYLADRCVTNSMAAKWAKDLANIQGQCRRGNGKCKRNRGLLLYGQLFEEAYAWYTRLEEYGAAARLQLSPKRRRTRRSVG